MRKLIYITHLYDVVCQVGHGPKGILVGVVDQSDHRLRFLVCFSSNMYSSFSSKQVFMKGMLLLFLFTCLYYNFFNRIHCY